MPPPRLAPHVCSAELQPASFAGLRCSSLYYIYICADAQGPVAIGFGPLRTLGDDEIKNVVAAGVSGFSIDLDCLLRAYFGVHRNGECEVDQMDLWKISNV